MPRRPGRRGLASSTTERENYRLAHARFVERQRLPRALARRDELEAFLADPPLTPLAADPARKVIAGAGRR